MKHVLIAFSVVFFWGLDSSSASVEAPIEVARSSQELTPVRDAYETRSRTRPTRDSAEHRNSRRGERQRGERGAANERRERPELEEEQERWQRMTPQMRRRQMRIRAQEVCEERGRGGETMELRECMTEKLRDFRDHED